MIERLSGRVVYANDWMTVREDRVVHASGAHGIYGYVDKADFALVIPRTPTGFWMVQEHRYPVGERRWSFPQGGWPAGASGDAEALARAELAEEAGLTAGRITHLGRLDVAHGMSTQGMQVFLAEDLQEGEPRREETEADMVHRHVTEAEFVGMITGGRLLDSGSLAAYALYLHRPDRAA
ncbi:NUDIX domain-containing protein [Yinghuangia soli]|uniref:NUDIX hydrolase n=1 Tax=Yinghuangia soli TaxID=2908204 RepID=A0AA41U337_9ACTN|nr:NUDIX hydrolase [Yinghuangia soli]MCF2527699.1 NUDIX hydrolase [Yinghuangia soli]